jgi:formylglycine-generating enzyme required for sulfatase activity
LAKATDNRTSQRLLEGLALALAQAGQDAAAHESAQRAAELSQRTGQPLSWGTSPPTPRYQETHAERLREAQRAEQELGQAIAQRRTWSFAPDRSAERFLHETLVRLLADIESLATEQRPNVLRRLRWARELQDGKLSLAHPRARHTWDEARTAIQQNPRYREAPIELRDEDIHDLVPIGENPVTHLFECYHLPSAWDGVSDPRTIPIPAHEPDGSIRMDGDTGIVFVLLPGGKAMLGAQSTNAGSTNYSRMANGTHGPVRTATLEPFFLARHELSQGQWARLYGSAGARRLPSTFAAGIGSDDALFSFANPVESTTWDESHQLLHTYGLQLPSAAQWEYAARGGTQTGFWCGDDPASLLGNENVLDQSVLKVAPGMRDMHLAPYDDGFLRHARIGSFRPNPFGLYDMLGNVSEWCGDVDIKQTITLKPGEKVRTSSQSSRFILGGAFSRPPDQCLPSDRYSATSQDINRDTGLRVARALRP